MQIAGFVPNSFVDYPGKIAALVFAPGCNMNCWYCHNHHLLVRGADSVVYNPRSILADLERKKGFLDAVVLTGGEPTLQSGLGDFARAVKEMGYLVKLDTNGAHARTSSVRCMVSIYSTTLPWTSKLRLTSTSPSAGAGLTWTR